METKKKRAEELYLIKEKDRDVIVPLVRDDDRNLTDEERRQFHAFWDKYKFMYKPHELSCKTYTNRTGIFNPLYISFGLYVGVLRPLLHMKNYNICFKNKNYVEKLFPEFNHTKVLLRRIRTCFLDADYKKITLDEAVNICKTYFEKENEFVIKPVIGGSALGVQFIKSDISDRGLYDLFKEFKEDFIVQHLIHQHESLAAIHPSSVQTIRVYSIHHKGKVEYLTSVLRMGASGGRADNLAAGGFGCLVDENGNCANFVFDHEGSYFDAHPNGFKPAGFKIKNFDKIKQQVQDAHIFIPQIWCIAWDFTLDQDGEPHFVEFNTRGDITIPQSGGKAYLGDLTREVLDDAFKKYHIDRTNFFYHYQEYHDHIRILEYFGAKRNLKIPSHMRGKPVTEIYRRAFKGNKGIRSVIVPNTVKKIFIYAFFGCSNLKKIKLSNAMKAIPSGMCGKCPSLKLLHVPDSVKRIPAVTGSGRKDLTFECSENSAAHEFAVSRKFKIKELAPSKKKKWKDYEYVVTQKTVEIEKYLGKESQLVVPKKLSGYPVVSIGNQAFSKNAAVKKVVLPDSIQKLGVSAFAGCKNLGEVVVSEGLSMIRSYCFSNCSALTRIELPKSLTTIYKNAFQNCISLKEIKLPRRIKTINAKVFCGCKKLRSIELSENLEKICFESFKDCAQLTDLYFFDEKTGGSKRMGLPATISHIGKDAFGGCVSLKNITIPALGNSDS